MYPKVKIVQGKDGEESGEEENLYSKERRETLMEEDVLNPEEDAFMDGYEEGFPDWGEEEDEDDMEWRELS